MTQKQTDLIRKLGGWAGLLVAILTIFGSLASGLVFFGDSRYASIQSNDASHAKLTAEVSKQITDRFDKLDQKLETRFTAIETLIMDKAEGERK